MSVATRPLGDFCRVQSGFAFKSKDWQDDGVPVVQIGNVKPRHLDLSSSKFVSSDVAASAEKFRLKDGDILISMTGHIGSVARKIGNDRVMLNQRVGRFEDIETSELDPDFLFEVLQSPQIRQRFVKLGYGAAQPNISPKLIGSVEIPIPPIETQRRIAAILGVYDDLIEVNRRRVAVLEEMARGLFEEWFVRFCFPGHEAVPILETPDGPLPEGWQYEPLGSVADINASSLRPANAPDQIGYIDIASVSPGRIDAVNWMLFSDAPGRARRKVRDGSILWSNVRPNRCSYALVTDPAPNVVASTGFTVLDAKRTSFAYLYHSVTTHDFVGYLVGNASGAAYPAVTAAVFERASILVPPPNLIEAFTRFSEPSMRQVASLFKANEKLAASRDLLLPRLISGQLSVETAERELEFG